MSNKIVHIVSFDNPFPPFYGGIIEVYYKLKPIHELGVSIYFHCFVDTIPNKFDELKDVTSKVFFYKKNKNPFLFFSYIPFSVFTRNNRELVQNIESADAPILFEGLKTTYLVKKGFFKNKIKILRLHNIEQLYFKGISKSETNFIKKILFSFEALKFKKYENVINEFQKIITLSKNEETYIINNFIKPKTNYIPVFHGNKIVKTHNGFGKYAVYHGDLRMSDNKKAVIQLIDIFKKINYNLVIAASENENFVQKRIKNYNNISFVKINDFEHLQDILVDAHINIMISFQQSGTKLKLLNSLYNSRFCLINENISDDSKLTDLCEFVSSSDDIISKVESLINIPFSDFEKRKMLLESYMNDDVNAKLLINTIFENDL
ncbi:hypothetical protein [Flavobacterium capsici]|uniref:Glycosyltransferase n=1 Tax=Flavobacterium capsici TaxID=3075618 RepID=A0AA96J1U1_9FLAO|nr:MULTISPECIES: hypothetical protein [unclassified Flavobacterium]WNM18747.1 hypothetical protein RN608_12105 [Flavobacterium sp. PMR2A8]WNM22798.1 hypothetical protein RN605_05405 [Flavobacterium sp. PMTSA4]